MRPHTPPTRPLVVLLALLVVAAVGPAGATPTADRTITPTADRTPTATDRTLTSTPDPHRTSAPDRHRTSAADRHRTPVRTCERDDASPRLGRRGAEHAYAAGLANDSAAGWTTGTVVPIGAHGDCSLAVVGETTAALTAATVNTSSGVVVATVDVGDGGALRFVGTPGPNGSTESIAVRNVGRENGARVAVVARDGENGTYYRKATTLPSGRFVDVAARWHPNGTVTLAFWDPEERRPDGWDLRVDASPEREAWVVRLASRAFLDEIAVGTRATDTAAEGGAGSDGDAGTTPDDRFDGEFGPSEFPDDGDGSDGSDGQQGLVFGPLLAGFGALVYRFAYGLTRFDEQLDAIGSKTRSSEVEPADWNVALTKVAGAGLVLAGVVWFLGSL